MLVRTVIPAWGLLVIFTSLVSAQGPSPSDWTQLRGTAGNARAADTARPPVSIDLSRQTRWETEIPGTGWSSPVYQAELIWLTTAVTQKASAAEVESKLKDDPLAQIKTVAKSIELRAIAVDRESGEIVHNRLLRTIEDPEPINPMNSYASPTPAIGQGRVICHFGSYGTWCLDAVSGQPVWDVRYEINHSVGPGSSPVIIDGKVILVCDGTDKQFVVAVDLASGREVWKTPRPPMRTPNPEYRKAYSTPLEIRVDGQPQIVIPGAQWVAAYAPADGREIWRADHGDGFSVTPMASYESGLILFSTGYMRPEFVAVDPRGQGDVTDTHIRWRAAGATKMPSFVVDQGRLYSIADNGILNCLEVATGKVLQRNRIGGNFSSSPILAGGNLYLSSREGVLTVVACSSDLQTVASSKLGDSIMATPVLIGDDLLVRTDTRLMRLKPDPDQ